MKPSLVSIATRLVGPFFALAAPVQANVLVVGYPAGPGVDFTDIQEAIEAAADGDTILVRGGGSGVFVIVGKSLTVLADGPPVFIWTTFCGPPTCTSDIEIHDLDANQSVLIRGFRTMKDVRVADCAGAVWFEDVQTGFLNSPFNFRPGAEVTDSAQVTFTRCVLHGVSNSNYPADGLIALRSGVQLFDCSIRGGTAWQYPVQGRAGMVVEGSTVTVAGCTIQGAAAAIRITWGPSSAQDLTPSAVRA